MACFARGSPNQCPLKRLRAEAPPFQPLWEGSDQDAQISPVSDVHGSNASDAARTYPRTRPAHAHTHPTHTPRTTHAQPTHNPTHARLMLGSCLLATEICLCRWPSSSLFIGCMQRSTRRTRQATPARSSMVAPTPSARSRSSRSRSWRLWRTLLHSPSKSSPS